MGTRLNVNIDHIATVRNARGTSYPDPSAGAQICLEAGADGITAHLREDRRHITDADLPKLREITREYHRILNFEMAPTDEMLAIAGALQPNLVTLVPERREERTTEGGLDVLASLPRLSAMVAKLEGTHIRTSMFIAPDLAQVKASKAAGAQMVEFHTGPYAHAHMHMPDATLEAEKIAVASRAAAALGLGVAFGHGLTRGNVAQLLRAYPAEELNIGHALISDALFLSLREAVLEMRAAIESASASA
jgi:pyridoxine 5-phosphate synthase